MASHYDNQDWTNIETTSVIFIDTQRFTDGDKTSIWMKNLFETLGITVNAEQPSLKL